MVLIIWIVKRTLSKMVRSRATIHTTKVEQIEGVESLPGGPAPALPAPSAEPSETNLDTIRAQVNQEVERDPIAAAEVLRKWLTYTNEDTVVQERSETA
jgi:flagellar biosynthesis/type III secretory pathway M-ring protein FliF/YscJ